MTIDTRRILRWVFRPSGVVAILCLLWLIYICTGLVLHPSRFSQFRDARFFIALALVSLPLGVRRWLYGGDRYKKNRPEWVRSLGELLEFLMPTASFVIIPPIYATLLCACTMFPIGRSLLARRRERNLVHLVSVADESERKAVAALLKSRGFEPRSWHHDPSGLLVRPEELAAAQSVLADHGIQRV